MKAAGNIVTFYSYKGGVGRTMAMANVAVLLAQRGLKVLVVDWDLEAPGLERYFGYFNVELPKGGGLLALLEQQKRGARSHYVQHLTTVAGSAGGKPFELSLLPSGRDSYPKYLATLEGFDWESYFENGGGDFIEELRNRWRNDFDVTLIDSRTGLSDTGGICTIQLPDIVVALFTANYQSLHGVLDTMQLAKAARDSLEYDRMQLRVLPVPTRFSRQGETEEATEWIERIAEVLEPFYKDWLGSGEQAEQMVRSLRIPQIDSFGLGEKLAAVESDPSAAEMTAVYERIAGMLVLPPTEAADVAAFSAATTAKAERSARPSDGYLYDIFVSHAATSVQVEWLDEFVKTLREVCASELGRPVNVFIDHSEIRSGETLSESVLNALLRSRVLLAYVTPGFVDSRWCRLQWATFERREMETKTPGLILPVSPRNPSTLPEWIRRRQVIDIAALPTVPSELRRGGEFVDDRLVQVGELFAGAIRKAPAFDRDWRVIEFSEAPPPPISVAPLPPDLPSGSVGVDAMVALIEKDARGETLERARDLFRGLVDKRDPAAVAKLGAALRSRAALTPDTAVAYARALLETAGPREALKAVGPVLRAQGLPAEVLADARVLAAEAEKRGYIEAASKSRAASVAALKRAIAAYRDALKLSPDVAVAVDFLALRSTARRLKVSAGTAKADKRAARDHLRRLAKVPTSLRAPSHERYVAELNLVLGRWPEVETHLAAFLALDHDARELDRLLVQLTDIWDVEAMEPQRKPLVDLVRAKLLGTSGGAVNVAVRSLIEPTPPRAALERVLGAVGTKTFDWWKAAVTRAQSVGSVRDESGQRVATCFAVAAREFGFELDEVVVLTTQVAQRNGQPLRFEFEIDGSPVQAAGTILWQSAPHDFDALIVRLNAPPKVAPLPLAPELPSLDRPHRVYVVGYPGGGERAISFQDGELLDHGFASSDSAVTRVHYRAATGPGSAGSPVFDESWNLLAIHRSRSAEQPRLNGRPGSYDASEGVGVLSLASAARSRMKAAQTLPPRSSGGTR